MLLVAAAGVQKACFSKKKFEKLSYAWEFKLKGLLKELIEVDADLIENSYLNDAAAKIVKRLSANIEDNPYKIEVLIVKSHVVNAFAFPGGLIVVYSGIIEKTAGAEEFAGLLAHELGHIIHRDSLHALARIIGLGVLLTIGGSDSTAVLREVLRMLVNNTFSRRQEAEADEFAAKLLIRSGINPRHLADFLSNLKESGGGAVNLKGPWVYLSTHPDMDSRIESARDMGGLFRGEEKKFDIDWSRYKAAGGTGSE